MTDNSSKNLTVLLTEVAGSVIDLTTLTVTAAKTVTQQMTNSKDVMVQISNNISHDEHLQDVMNMIDDTVADHLNFYMSAIVGPIICLLGMTGNLLSIITWSRTGMKGSTGRYLTGQAIANFAVLLMFLLSDSIQYWSPDVTYSPIYGSFFSYFGFPIFFFSTVCCVWFTVGVTIDRYLMVCWITKAKNLCSESRATCGLTCITVSAFIINIPHFSFFTPVYPDPTSNDFNNTRIPGLKVGYVLSEFGMSEVGQFYEFWVHCMFLVLIPWVSVLFMNVMIIIKINKANKTMESKKTAQAMKKSRESENQITRLLLVVTFTFLAFVGLTCITHCLWMKQPPCITEMMLNASFAFGKTGILFNASMNFVLYCLSGKRFRVELLKLIGLHKKGMIRSSMDTSSSNISTNNTTSAINGISRCDGEN